MNFDPVYAAILTVAVCIWCALGFLIFKRERRMRDGEIEPSYESGRLQARQLKTTCDACGTRYDATEERCPVCGSENESEIEQSRRWPGA